MKKTFEQIVLEGQVAECSTLEELYLLWQLMQQMEPEPEKETGYADIDFRNFHIDGIVSQKDFNGTLYILKETNMKKYIQKGQSFPVISDVRKDLAQAKSSGGEVEYMEYLAGMQEILNRLGNEKDGNRPVEEKKEENRPAADIKTLLSQTAVLYLNKRGGKGAADDISIRYAQYYIAFIKRQIELLNPKTIVCCGEEIFRLVVMEVFQNKKRKKNHGEYMKWKNVVVNDVFLADSRRRPTTDEEKAAYKVINMWNPAYRVNNGQYVSLEEYLKEFYRRVKKTEPEEKNL